MKKNINAFSDIYSLYSFSINCALKVKHGVFAMIPTAEVSKGLDLIGVEIWLTFQVNLIRQSPSQVGKVLQLATISLYFEMFENLTGM